MLKSAILSLLTACLASTTPPQTPKTNYGPVQQPKTGLQQVAAHADMGFYAFSFGEAKTYAFQSFNFKLRDTSFLSITDCYFPGDSFQVFDNGYPVAITNDCTPLGTELPEDHYLDNAWACLSADAIYFCKSQVLLNPGHHNITIAVINSPLGGGAGFIRIDKFCPRPGNLPQIPCCQIEADGITEDPTGRLCNQMVTFP